MERKTEALRLEREAKDRELIEDQVAKRLTAEHAQLVAAESKKAREAAAAELQAKEAEAAELRAALLTNNAKLAEAQKQAESARSRTLGPWPAGFSPNLVWHDCDLHRSRRDLGPQVITPVAGRHRFTSA
jgi:hypothetical protein